MARQKDLYLPPLSSDVEPAVIILVCRCTSDEVTTVVIIIIACANAQ
jgi:hypothetical protein